MLHISAKTDYGLLLMVALAEKQNKQALSLRTLAAERRLPYRYLSRIAGQLKDAGLISAKEGVQGGYRLARRPKQITIGEILRALEGDTELVRCHERGGSCPSASMCSLSPFWRGIGKRLNGALDTLTLDQLSYAK